jgi:hypothetical protein
MQSSAEDPEIQAIMLQQQLEANVTVVIKPKLIYTFHFPNDFMKIHRIAKVCWSKCITYTDNELSSKQEACLGYCADRFLDTTMLITQKFNQRFNMS